MSVLEAKTGKIKTVTVSDELAERLAAVPGNVSEYVFRGCRSPSKHYDRTTYHRHIKCACRASTIDFSAHSTRKLYALNVYYKNYDIYEVQKALNHKYITTTATYMGLDLIQLIKDAMQHKIQT